MKLWLVAFSLGLGCLNFLAESFRPSGPGLPYAEYHLDEGPEARAGSVFADGVFLGEPESIVDRHGNPNGAFLFNGAESLKIPEVDLTWETGTISFWFRLDQHPEFAATLMSLSALNGIFNVSIDRDVLRTAWGNGGQGIHFGRPRMELGTWYHYSLTWVDGGREFRVSLDGQYFRRNLSGDPEGRSFKGDLHFSGESTFIGALDDIFISQERVDRRSLVSVAEVDLEKDSDGDGRSDFEEHGLGNYELVVNAGLTWREANEFAAQLGGYLATFTSMDEWAPFDFKGADRGFQFGGTYGGRSRGWQWGTGEPWSFELWPPSGTPILGRGVTVYSPHPGLPETHYWSATTALNKNNFLIEYGLRSDPNDPDSDDDGINDGDEVNKHSTVPTNPDSDGDGIPDGIEVLNGMSPNLADKIQQGIIETFPALELSLFTLRGINYQLQKSTDLIEWGNDGEPFEGEGGPSSIFVRQVEQQAFWRLVEVD